MAKPVVDGIEGALEGKDAHVLKISVGSRIGRSLAGRFGIRGVPTLIVTDGAGEPVLRQIGRVNRESVLAAAAAASAR